MPRKYTRTTFKGGWTAEQLKLALEAINSGEMKVSRASEAYNIPLPTLKKRRRTGNMNGPKLGTKPTFSESQEISLRDRILLLSNLFYGITPGELRTVVFQFANENNIPHRFNGKNGQAGYDWLKGFLKRHESIKIRSPEATSINRISAFSREEVGLFYSNLECVMNKFIFQPSNIYNVDETGISTVQVPRKILSEKGKRRVGAVTSWERGKNVTVVCAMSASGSYVPPMFIFPRKRMTPALAKGGPPGSRYECSDNGWISQELFTLYLDHFIHHTKASKDNPVLLVLDNHFSHTTLEAYDKCRENGITMVSLPPHTSHRTQPLDVSFFAPLKAAFRSECDRFMRTEALKKITPYDLAELFNYAYSKVATVGTAVSGFQSTGIYPLNSGAFTDKDYLAADILTPSPELPVCTPNSSSTPSTSQGSGDESMPIESFMPLPVKTFPTKKGGRAKQHSQILTSTPRKDELLKKQEKKREKEMKIKKPKIEIVKRNIALKTCDVHNDSEAGPSKKKTKVVKPKAVVKQTLKKQKKIVVSDDSSETDHGYNDEDLCSDDEVDDILDSETIFCYICRENDSEDGLLWKCKGCMQWAHYLCSEGRPDSDLCELCESLPS